jgi:ubiquinone/menaquinone biosynthesis C-methylase UbiE
VQALTGPEEGYRTMGNSVRVLTERFYYDRPDWVDGTSQFGAIIRRYLRPESRVLDLGAGNGKAGPINFQGEVRSVTGVDSHSYISGNSRIDHGVVGLAEHLPFRKESFDLVVSDWVVEHLAYPEEVASEVFRVLRSGGAFVLRTGNLRHYSYAVAAATPHWFHRLVANRVRGIPQDSDDPHATYYRMNSRRAVRRCLTRAGFVEEDITMVEAEPSYLMFSAPSFLLGMAYERVVNCARVFSAFRACIFACFRKP